MKSQSEVFFPKTLPKQLKNIWYPFDRMTEDKNENDCETDFGQKHFILL